MIALWLYNVYLLESCEFKVFLKTDSRCCGESSIKRVWGCNSGEPEIFDIVINTEEDVDIEVCIYCEYETCDLDDICDHVVRCSQINGSNGEWTNKDDVNKNDENKRRKKETERGKYEKIGGGKKKTGELPKFNKQCRNLDCADQNCRFLHKDDVVVAEGGVVATSGCIEPTGSCYCFQGIKYTIKVNCVSSVLVNFEQDETSIVRIPEFIMFNTNFESRMVVVSHRLASVVLANLRILPDETRNLTATLNYLTSFLTPLFPAKVVYDHLWYYAFRNSGKATPSGNLIIQARELFVILNSSMISILPMVDSPNPDYEYNAGWKILNSAGFEMDVNVIANFTTKPRFLTQSRENKVSGRNYRAFCLFSPRAGFQTYANNAQNVCAALSRYFKCRRGWVEEQAYKSHQFRLLGSQTRGIVNLLAKVCDAEYLEVVNEANIVTGDVLRTRGCYVNTDSRNHRQTYFMPRRNSNFIGMLESNLFKNQYSLSMMWRKFTKHMREIYTEVHSFAIEYLYTPVYRYFDTYTLLVELANLPHPKKLLRLKWILDEKSVSRILENTGEFESKFKWEFGKVGKVGRLYATIAQNSLIANTTMNFIKFLTMRTFDLGILPSGGKMWAMYSDSASCEDSDELFRMVRKLPEDDVCYILFSDDGFICRGGENYKLYETDISSCDASNGFPVSAVLLWLAQKLELDEGMLQLLVISAKPTTIRNPDNEDEYVRLRPETTFEYSGETLTTIKNNIASIAIAYGIYTRLCEGHSLSEDSIVQGAYDFGWVLTVERKYTYNNVTFLKRCYSVSADRSWLVLGCVFRSFGVVDGDISPLKLGLSKSEYQKLSYSGMFEKLLQMRALGLVHEAPSPIINAIRKRCLNMNPIQEVITSQDYIERYNTTDHEISELVDIILDLKFGDIIVSKFLERIYSVDYGTKMDLQEFDYTCNFGDVDALM